MKPTLTPAILLSRFQAAADHLQTPLLFLVRVWWGWSFFLTGRGKLLHLGQTADYFGSLGIPLPKLNALAAGGTECLGGLLLLVGLCSRVAAVPLVFTLLVAYATAEREALFAVFSDPDKFTAATPFLFLLAVLTVLAFGPGAWSLDALIARRRTRRTPAPSGAELAVDGAAARN